LLKKLNNNPENHIIILTRNPNQPKVIELLQKAKFAENISFVQNLDKIPETTFINYIINLAGNPITGRWTQKVKEEIVRSRLSVTKALVNLVARLKKKPEVFISGSAIGYYGYGGDTPLDEDSPAQSVFISELCQAWEKQAELVKQYNVRYSAIRTGVVLGLEGGMIQQVLPAYRFFLGGPIGDGKQWLSWIHIDDYLSLIEFLVQHTDLSGPFNGTAPNPVQYNTFSEIFSRTLNRPNICRLPAFVIRSLFGEMGEALLLHGQRVIPKRAIESGFQFKYETLDKALNQLFDNQ